MRIRLLAFGLLVACGWMAGSSCGGSDSSGAGGTGPDASASGDPGTPIDASATTGHAGPDGSTADGALDSGDCAEIDLATYDRSCRTDSDCIPIATGTVCPGCMCSSAAINVSGRDRYFRTLLQLPPASGTCQGGCPGAGAATCVHGVCTYR